MNLFIIIFSQWGTIKRELRDDNLTINACLPSGEMLPSGKRLQQEKPIQKMGLPKMTVFLLRKCAFLGGSYLYSSFPSQDSESTKISCTYIYIYIWKCSNDPMIILGLPKKWYTYSTLDRHISSHWVTKQMAVDIYHTFFELCPMISYIYVYMIWCMICFTEQT